MVQNFGNLGQRSCGDLYILKAVLPRREDANKAIQRLNGHGYDNLILHVEWAQPRAER